MNDRNDETYDYTKLLTASLMAIATLEEELGIVRQKEMHPQAEFIEMALSSLRELLKMKDRRIDLTEGATLPFRV